MAQSLELLLIQFFMPDYDARRQAEEQIKRLSKDPRPPPPYHQDPQRSGYEAPVSVAGVVFCVPYNIDLVVRKKIKGLSEARYEVFDFHGRLLLQVHGGVL
ncbi:hypothetical protein MRB53_000738 [Persea americana]|uniref:Uncharacterized protein n=1 Tax=Persea americana TaxID=3435 RepID=A0ACC2MPZ6_PERAE|nr:hypothetical protein MRB53_000738 [Persea americana]